MVKSATLTQTKTTEPPLFHGDLVDRADLIRGELSIPNRGTTPRVVREAIKRVVLKKHQQELQALIAEVECALRDREDLKNALSVVDFFANAPADSILYVLNCQSPCEGLKTLLSELGEINKFIDVGVVEDLDPIKDEVTGTAIQKVDPLSETLTEFGEQGVKAILWGQIALQPYEQLLQWLVKYSLLGTQPGRDEIRVQCERYVQKQHDPNEVTAHSIIGALLGRRRKLDVTYHPAEPMDGDRNAGDGAKGGLLGGQLARIPGQAREFRNEQRKVLATHGINTARKWLGVGDAVVCTNRSLRSGGVESDPYVFASTSRFRAIVQAIFHGVAEEQIQGGNRTPELLEKACGLMNSYLQGLKSIGLLVAGNVTVDYESLVLRLRITFTPVLPIDNIVLEWTY